MMRAKVFDMAIESGLRNCSPKMWAASEDQVVAFARLCSANSLEVMAGQLEAQAQLADLNEQHSKAFWLVTVAAELRAAATSIAGDKEEKDVWATTSRLD